METYDILGVNVAHTNLNAASAFIEEKIKGSDKTYVCIAPVATIIDCQNDSKYREIINNAGMVTPDGMPLVWIGKFRKLQNLQRTYGPDLFLTLCRLSEEKGYKHYFYGGVQENIDQLIKNLKSRFPKLNIVGQYAPAFREIGSIEDEKVLDEINQSQADIVWIGLGSPKQDYWMADHREKLDAPVLIGVGAAFDYYAGTKPQAPVWMRKVGLEWLFRLCCEPGRLWKRYLLGNTQFLYLLLKNWISPQPKKVKA